MKGSVGTPPCRQWLLPRGEIGGIKRLRRGINFLSKMAATQRLINVNWLVSNLIPCYQSEIVFFLARNCVTRDRWLLVGVSWEIALFPCHKKGLIGATGAQLLRKETYRHSYRHKEYVILDLCTCILSVHIDMSHWRQNCNACIILEYGNGILQLWKYLIYDSEIPGFLRQRANIYIFWYMAP